MKQILISILLTVPCFAVYSQTSTTTILSKSEIEQIFTPSVKINLKIVYPILTVYRYSDKSGTNYCIFTESFNGVNEEKDSIHRNIKAVNAIAKGESIVKTWEINDNISKENDESTIWFSNKFLELKDVDGDGLVDPIIIYGTHGASLGDDGRVKIIIVYKGQKSAIRHQNGILDNQRWTQVDSSFYNLPKSIQLLVKQKLKFFVENNLSILTDGWESALSNKKTMIR